MAVENQKHFDGCSVYLGDCLEVISKIPDASIHLSVYSPPFCGLYHYSSSNRDMSNCRSYDEFLEHYGFLVAEKSRVTKPGRITAVHCTDIPSGNSGRDHMTDFSGDIIRLHERHGWKYMARYCVWKDPYKVYLRTMSKNLQHKTIVDDASRCSAAAADYMLVFRNAGENKTPIEHPIGLTEYYGSRQVPENLIRFRGWEGKQTENKYSQWVWRQYASAFWDDVRLDRVLPYRDAKDPEDERHVHPLQLDVIDRTVILWTNPGEVVLTPFMGVGSEVYSALMHGRKAIGIELKPSYFRQALLNIEAAFEDQQYGQVQSQMGLFDRATSEQVDEVLDNFGTNGDL